MLVRTWQTTFVEDEKQRLVDYANRVSLPALSSRPGNQGVLFYSQRNQWTTVTLWNDQASIDRLSDDPEYERIVEGIMALGILGSEQTTLVHEYEGGTLG